MYCQICKKEITDTEFCSVKTNGVDGYTYFHNTCFDDMWDLWNDTHNEYGRKEKKFFRGGR